MYQQRRRHRLARESATCKEESKIKCTSTTINIANIETSTANDHKPSAKIRVTMSVPCRTCHPSRDADQVTRPSSQQGPASFGCAALRYSDQGPNYFQPQRLTGSLALRSIRLEWSHAHWTPPTPAFKHFQAARDGFMLSPLYGYIVCETNSMAPPLHLRARRTADDTRRSHASHAIKGILSSIDSPSVYSYIAPSAHVQQVSVDFTTHPRHRR
ncbi:hypothetical protein BDP81DRAFT_432156 [Colletotrichum phormii]|uniref:Uncharacterized protein n=1 Tax=Colletotrichum phormii TaxID=359342 RepID=A0AAI9ZPX6_9PEZI|nr:uncharacterized protein BDP81DRAFT_432156 [Colletotrichum phormii]KAK1634878.1 hypothetical protein BDP81DRAFT_432156 [Colletotrichum phormii]